MLHRLHVVSLPHTSTTRAYSSCAYTEKVRKFCRMMTDRGHHVTLYAGEENEAPCSEHVVCMSENDRAKFAAGKHYIEAASFDPATPIWRLFNASVRLEMLHRVQPKDFICLIGGSASKTVADEFPANMAVEFGVGYAGTFAKYRVFESYAWMHAVHGARHGSSIMNAPGEWYDGVIPGYLEMEAFPKPKGKAPFGGDYVLFVGRLIGTKGIGIAADAARRAGKMLVVAGLGGPPALGCQWVGEVGPERRAELMGHARCLIAPTIYAEPFGNVVIEAQACGTPVVTTDWGAFTETVQSGVTGFRCRMLSEFVGAIKSAPGLNRAAIRARARKNYSLEAIGPQYERYFDRLMTMWGKGFYEE